MADNHHHGHHEKYDHYSHGLMKVPHAHPMELKCPKCQYVGLSHCDTHNSVQAWAGCLVLCLVGCSIGCCLIPFCLEDCKNATHTCTQCGQEVAYKKALEHH